jgi:hypothetical protein
MTPRLMALVLMLGAAAVPRAQTGPRLSSGQGGAPAAPAGLTVVLLIDVTSSMTRTPVAFDSRYAQVYNAFLQGLAPGDRAGVGLIADKVTFTELTSDQRALSASVRALFRVPDSARLGPSPVWDAIDEAVVRVAEPNRKGAIVLFSDAKSAGNRKGLDEVVEHARRRRVIVSSVVEGPGSMLLARANVALDPADAMQKLADATGGTRLLDRPFNPRDRNPGPMIALLMENLRK